MHTQHFKFHCKMIKLLWFHHTQSRLNFLLLSSEQQISELLHVFQKALAHPRNYLTNEANHENLNYSFFSNALFTIVIEYVEHIRKSWLTHITLFTKNRTWFSGCFLYILLYFPWLHVTWNYFFFITVLLALADLAEPVFFHSVEQ